LRNAQDPSPPFLKGGRGDFKKDLTLNNCIAFKKIILSQKYFLENYTRQKRGKTMEEMKMMLVDDEERFLSTTQKLLAKKGYDVVTASSGAEALEKLRLHNIHVVVLDVKMPGMDGIETLKAIKKTFPLVEVIMLTGHATVESAVEGLKSGATDYLMKPTDVKDLIQKAEDAFGKRQVLEEKIRVAQTRSFMKSPREIIRDTE
jgi:DNA-binding NtrC family response regulator